MPDDTNLYQVFNTIDESEYEHYAALDIGSNSFHLVVVRVVEGSLQLVNKVKHKVRLAEGLDSKNRLSQEYIDLGTQALQAMASTLQGLPHQKVRVVATYTLRKAVNSKDFLRAAKKVFPYQIDIVAGAEEARLIYVGVTSSLRGNAPHLVFDIGGGSTEFAIGEGLIPDICRSLNMGCVSFHSRFFADDKITQKGCKDAITAAKRELELPSISLCRFKWEKVYASSGTAKAIANVIHYEESGEPTHPFTQHELQLLLARCIEKGHSDNLDFPGLTDERKPVFVAGLCIMLGIFQSLQIENVEYTPPALREGVLYELQPEQLTQNVCLRTAQSMAKRYHVDTAFAHNVLQTSMHLYAQVKADWHLDSPQFRFILGWASLLHEVGLQINSKGIQKHSAYILQQSEMPGFHQEQQMLISVLVRFHRKRIRLAELPEFVNYDKQQVIHLLLILRLSILLNLTRAGAVVPDSISATTTEQLQLSFDHTTLAEHPLLATDLHAEASYWNDIEFNLALI
ncbi:exopolyphosphatase [Agaribacter marinus]|uniref:Exopolyphosphatase n=1 Tax=Agaribacter marinus TaxID=1431249 RepID=A0AA37WIK6_9ALTE|nr:exopolyphosphatase [Agaribacter marinus]GLR71087.1 exopolyphosphatase [Agaribacter marinus]